MTGFLGADPAAFKTFKGDKTFYGVPNQMNLEDFKRWLKRYEAEQKAGIFNFGINEEAKTRALQKLTEDVQGKLRAYFKYQGQRRQNV